MKSFGEKLLEAGLQHTCKGCATCKPKEADVASANVSAVRPGTGAASALAKADWADEPTKWAEAAAIVRKHGPAKFDDPDAACGELYKRRGGKAREASNPVTLTPSDDAAVAQLVMAPVAESARGSLSIRTKLREADGATAGKGNRFRCTLIREGMGNFGSCHYYPASTISGAAQIFEGKKIYCDHPTLTEETVQPERTVRDILGHFENVTFQTSKEDGLGELVGDLVLMEGASFDWARSLMQHTLEYSKKFQDADFVGLSINAAGDSEKARLTEFKGRSEIPKAALQKLEEAAAQGIEEINVVNKIVDAQSCDLVTEAGAGGKINKLVEGDLKVKKETETAAAEKQAADATGAKGDANQDMELIKKMLKDYVGDAEHPEETVAQAKEAYEAAKESGLEEKEAMKMAGQAMKMAGLMSKKKQSKEAADKVAADKAATEAAGAGAGDAAVTDAAGDKTTEAAKVNESNKPAAVTKLREENTRLAGEVAQLKEAIRKRDLKDHVEKTLSESKLPRSATKAARASFDECKTVAEFDRIFKVFQEGFKANAGEGESMDFLMEKNTGASDTNETSFADCVV